MKRKIDINDDFDIYCYQNGIMLLPPNSGYLSPFLRHTGHTVYSFFQSEFNTFVLDTESRWLRVNETVANIVGCYSKRSLVGISVFDISSNENAQEVRLTDLDVMKNKKPRLINDAYERPDGNTYAKFLSLKLPLFNRDNNVIGIFGCSIAMGQHHLADSLTKIMRMNLLNQVNTKPFNFDNNSLSKRESETLYYLIRGKSSRQIGLIFGISKRTVDQYVNNIKFKMRVETKSQLLSKVTDVLL